ncbi:hypothetical protein AG0111_0g12223 [Alternaria gaisen]|uniref:Uncharacterized protein n=1 Tax=Alternaria gaisen TaxID=167740 RepID=A0ACB6F5E0_9PLEO|nr:hypothetical protein AG0111_0g12223 [Alternaria gaisen]
MAAAKSIYRVGSPFMKSSWYSFFTGEATEPNLFTIKNLELYIAKTARPAIERIAGDIKEHGHSDIYKWFTFMATDVVGQSSFGESFRMLETGIKTQYVKDLEEVPVRGMLRAEFPLLMNILYYLPFGSKEVQRSRERIADYSKESIMKYWNLLKIGEEDVKPALLTKAYDAVEDGSMTTSQLEREAIVYLVAGTDTTALSAIYTVWNLACHPKIEAAVIQEVAALPDGFTDDNLRKCKLLNNVLTETLRIRPPIGQGAIVGVQAWSMHHNPTAIKDPEKFIPARWDNLSTDMLQSFYTFGGGSRASIGAHFAQLELRHALANFYRTYTKGVTASSARSFSKAEMEVDTYFMTLPKGKRCVIEPKE